jgi:choline dehydrogenase
MAASTPLTFDYVIVGAGPAGSALAGRLAEDQGTRVCVLEAGGSDQRFFIDTPAMVAAAIATPSLNWRFETVPQAHLKGRRILQPRGKVVGGSGAINGMVYSRGNPRDYADWVTAGANGWSYAEVLPYFLRTENNQDLPVSRYHAQGGPMNVMRPRNPNPLNHDFISAALSLGFPRTDDFTGITNEGVGLRQGVIRAGRRETTAKSFLRPALSRGNVTLYTEALVLRVIVEQGRAVGVTYERAGLQHEVRANREVILSAGTLQTPQILQLSGIGPAEQLQTRGIPTVLNLPGVGRNLQDHLACPVMMSTADSTSYGISAKALPRGIWNVLQYLIGRTGPLASNVFESVGFLKTQPALDRPDVQFVFQPAARPRPSFPLPIGHGFAISPVSLYPKSRGTVTLQSADPHVAPAIDPALLSVAEDIDPLIRAIKIARRILSAQSFARYHASETAPGASVQSDADIADFIRGSSYTVHHQVGTCRMGEHSQAVVDSQLRLRGIESLRVVDASVMPLVIGGNTNAVAVMIAEKAADLIRQRPLLPPAQLAPAQEP